MKWHLRTFEGGTTHCGLRENKWWTRQGFEPPETMKDDMPSAMKCKKCLSIEAGR